jgi:hypothetical protein
MAKKVQIQKRELDRVTYTRDPISKMLSLQGYQKSSFSDHVAHAATKMMKANNKKVSPENLAILGINYAIKLSQTSL